LITSSDQLTRLVTTDSIGMTPEVAACKKIERASIGKLLAEAIRRIANEESVSSLFD
ncbi:MAG: ribose-phosphate pyrophosphokinase, partial [Pseudomonadota bacterium]